MAERGGSRVHERWARLRFSIIGALLAAPPAKGALRAALEALAAREWRHPSTGEPVRFTANFLWMCQGYYRHSEGYTPDWPGMADFAGTIHINTTDPRMTGSTYTFTAH